MEKKQPITRYGAPSSRSPLNGYGVPRASGFSSAFTPSPSVSPTLFSSTFDRAPSPAWEAPTITTTAPLFRVLLADDPGEFDPTAAPVRRQGTSLFARTVATTSLLALILFSCTRNPGTFRAGWLPGMITGIGTAIIGRAVEAMTDRRRQTSLFNLPVKHYADRRTSRWKRLAYLILLGSAAYAVHSERQYLPLVAGLASGLLAGEFLAFQVTKRL